MNIDKPTRRGRIDWQKVRATSEDDKHREAAEEDRALGLDRAKLRYSPVLNVTSPDVRKVREHLHLSQARFAARFGISVRTVQQWEQQRSTPDQPAKILLRVIAFAPDLVSHAIDDAFMERRLAKTPITLSPITMELFSRFLAYERAEGRASFITPRPHRRAVADAPDPNAGAVYAAA